MIESSNLIDLHRIDSRGEELPKGIPGSTLPTGAQRGASLAVDSTFAVARVEGLVNLNN